MRDLDSERAQAPRHGEQDVSITLRMGRQVVGRATECDIVVQHSTVSRHHAEVVVGTLTISVRDLGSRNGTFVNRARIQEATVRNLDRVQFGALPFHVEERPPRLVRCLDLEESTTDQVTGANTGHQSPTLLLSPARQRVFDCLLEGLSEKQIATRLAVSVHTIHNQVRDIYRQFNVNSRAELLASFLPRPK